MPIIRPAGILCEKWEPVSTGSKRCRYYIEPGTPQSEGLCKLPDEMLCVEWVRRYGTDAQKQQLAARSLAPLSTQPRGATPAEPDAPAPLVLASPPVAPARPPAVLRTVQGAVQMAPPKPFEPAKEIDPSSLEALERAGVEVELAAPYIEGGITLVPARTGRTDRSEMTFREAATIRLIVDCFPGAHVTAYRPGPGEVVEEELELNGHRPADLPFDAYPLAGTRCSDCGKPQRTTPGGLSCVNGHGGAEPMEEDPLS